MKQKRYTEEQIVGIVKGVETGKGIVEVCRVRNRKMKWLCIPAFAGLPPRPQAQGDKFFRCQRGS